MPHKVVKKYTHSDKPHITIWSAINSELVIGPIFFTGGISSEAYKQTLKNFVSDLHQISNENEHPILVQDDSKLHSNAEVVEFLEKEFPNHWIGTESKYAKWPHHSSDLSPINFFLWGYIKSRVYKTPIETGDVDELKKRIEAAFKNVTPDLLEEAIEEYKTRLERVVKTNGHLVDATIYGEEIDYDQLNVWGMYNWQYL
uniref:Tc1-like transposase DDE domain-containing protein n=1 Tax=Acrobeloides nanus TaxID=290746 RepID=A0A914D1Q5_9BILA